MDKELVILYLGKPPTVPPSAITEGDYDDVLARLMALEADLVLDALADVRTTGLWTPNDGDILRYNEPAEQWEPFPLANTIESIDNTTSVNLTLTGTELTADVNFAGTGSASTAARSDHSLSAPVGKRATFAATGVLSSGTRNLVTTTFGPLTSGITYDIEGWFVVRARNNVNNGTCTLKCRIGSDGAYPENTRVVQTVGGVPVDQHIDFGDANGDMVAVGAGSNLTISFSVQFTSADAVDLRDGFYRVVAKPRR